MSKKVLSDVQTYIVTLVFALALQTIVGLSIAVGLIRTALFELWVVIGVLLRL